VKKPSTVDALKKASKGLLFPSETDAPLTPFVWKAAGDKLTQGRVLELVEAEKDVSVDVLSLDDLLQTVPSEDLPKFQEWAATIKKLLSGVKVYKVGDEPERDVYIVGKDPDGQFAGLKTQVVET